MSKVQAERLTADLPTEGAVVFLIGMRINRMWDVRSWGPVFTAMPRMLIELARHPELGLRGRPRTFVSGRTILVWQQWESFDHLEAYAKSTDHDHLPAWREFNRKARATTSVGIYHETYLVDPANVESIYVNMPAFGLGKAFGTIPAVGRLHFAPGRLGKQENGPALADERPASRA